MHEDMFFSSWLREDTEGKAEEVEEMRKRTKEDETKSGKGRSREKEKGSRWHCKRVCVEFCSGLLGNPCEQSGGARICLNRRGIVRVTAR